MPRCREIRWWWRPTWAARPQRWRWPMSDHGEVLRVRGLQAWYGESHILHGVDFSVREGEVVSLLGRNGAGRTSTLRALLGLTDRRTGSVEVRGCETIALA